MTELIAKANERTAMRPDSRARLILEDPVAFDQTTQPILRSSTEMTSPTLPVMDRDMARDMWENLSMESAQAQQLHSERKRLLAHTNQLASELEKNAAELNAVKTQAAIDRENRWNHPLTYASTASILGLGALWLLERRQRMQLQERELQAWAVHTPMDSLDDTSLHQIDRTQMTEHLDGPAIEESLPEKLAVPKHDPDHNQSDHDESTNRALRKILQTQDHTDSKSLDVEQDAPMQAPAWAISPRAEEAPEDDELRLASMSPREYQESLLGKSRRVLRSMLQRRTERAAFSSSHASTQAISTGMSTAGMSTLLQSEHTREAAQWLPNDEAREALEQEQLARQLQADLRDSRAVGYDADQANIELLSQTRLKPMSQDTAVEHLLELRTAVNGLVVLGRPEGALVLLADHIDAHPDTCAWAYLEHMMLCERLDLRDEFESMRKRYRVQFNRMAPYWHEPNANVLGLDGYARAANELCTAWAQGSQPAHDLIAAWLIGPILGRKLVQMPAYQDLFDLYELLEFTPENLAAHSQEVSEREIFNLSMRDALERNSELPQDDFLPTVSLLDLDYEFSSDVTLEEKAVKDAERAVTIVKPGNFSVDFNVAGTQIGGLFSVPAELDKK